MKLHLCMELCTYICKNLEVVLSLHTVMILSFWTNRSGQTVQTQIRLILEEQSDQGLHCLSFHLHFCAKNFLSKDLFI